MWPVQPQAEGTHPVERRRRGEGAVAAVVACGAHMYQGEGGRGGSTRERRKGWRRAPIVNTPHITVPCRNQYTAASPARSTVCNAPVPPVRAGRLAMAPAYEHAATARSTTILTTYARERAALRSKHAAGMAARSCESVGRDCCFPTECVVLPPRPIFARDEWKRREDLHWRRGKHVFVHFAQGRALG